MFFRLWARADVALGVRDSPQVARVHLRENDEEAHRRIQRLTWLVGSRGEGPELRQLQHQHAHPSHGRHIFISYCPERPPTDELSARNRQSQSPENSGERIPEKARLLKESGERIPDKVRLLKEALQGAGFRVWCNGPGGDIEEMAEAISCSSIFIMCATKAFKENNETRLEGTYAEEARRAVIVCAIESEIDRNFGWIAQLAQGRQGIDFIGEAAQNHPAIMRLVNIALQWLGPPRQVPPPASPRMEMKAIGRSSSPQTRPQGGGNLQVIGSAHGSPPAKRESSMVSGDSREGAWA